MVEVAVGHFLLEMRQLSGRDSDQGRNSSRAFVVALGSSVNRYVRYSKGLRPFVNSRIELAFFLTVFWAVLTRGKRAILTLF